MTSIRAKIVSLLFLIRSKKSILKEYVKLKEFEYKSLVTNLQIQKNNLENILLHSWKNVPYYTKILEEAQVVHNGKVNLKNFSEIKILDKETLHDNFDQLMSIEKDRKKRKIYLNSSGGSTGEPTKFIQDQQYKVKELATKWLFYSYIADFPTKHISLWGSERDIIRGGLNLSNSVLNSLLKKKTLNSFRMTQENIENYIKEINSYKPIFLEAYVQPIHEIARYIKEKKIEIFSPTGIITSAGTLYPEIKEIIEEVFQCPVLNRYGSREIGDVACSCERNQGLHINIINNYIEILDKKLQPVKPGEIGQIYITKLTNFTMPLIRYKIGDLGIPSDNPQCECGRGFPLLKFVEGRETSVFRTRKGTIVSSEFFIHFLGVVYNKGIISKFQVIQKDYDRIIIKFIPKETSGLEEFKSKISNSIKKVMGSDCEVFWEKVTDIPPLPNGKYLYTYSEIS